MTTTPRTFALALAGAAVGAVLGVTASTVAEPFPRPGMGMGSGGGHTPAPFALRPGAGTGSGGVGIEIVLGTSPAGGCTGFCTAVPDAPSCAETTCAVAPDGTVTRADGSTVTDPQDLTDRELDNPAYIERRQDDWDAYVADRNAAGSDQ